MRGRDFLRDKLPQMAILLFVTLFLCGILYAYRLNALGILFVAACILLGAAAGYWIEYARRRGFYRNLLEEMEELSPKYLIAEMLEEPSFFEGKVLCQVVREAGKSMNDHIALYKNASDEYREYIEAWVHEVKTPIASARLLALNHPGPVMESMDEEISKINGFVEQALYYSKSNCLEKDYVISKVNLEEPVKKALKQHAKGGLPWSCGILPRTSMRMRNGWCLCWGRFSPTRKNTAQKKSAVLPTRRRAAFCCISGITGGAFPKRICRASLKRGLPGKTAGR